MLKKLMLVVCASLLLVPTDAFAKNKCKRFCSLFAQCLRARTAIIDGDLTVNGTINNTAFIDVINNINAITSDFVFAFSTTPQPFEALAGIFQPITIDFASPIDGWAVDLAGNFTVPATGLYLISYSGGIGAEEVGVLVSANIAAFTGPQLAGVFVPGSDSSVQIDAAVTAIQNASASFLLNATAGQNLWFGFLADSLDGTVSLEATGQTPAADTSTTFSVSITRIR